MGLRLTVQVQLVLQALLRDPAREMYGLESSEETGVQPGTAYPDPSAAGTRGLGDQPLGGRRSASGKTPGAVVLPPDGRRRGPGQRRSRRGAAPKDTVLRRLAEAVASMTPAIDPRYDARRKRARVAMFITAGRSWPPRHWAERVSAGGDGHRGCLASPSSSSSLPFHEFWRRPAWPPRDQRARRS